MRAEFIRRAPDGAWPATPATIEVGTTIALTSIGADLAMTDVYAGTHLA